MKKIAPSDKKMLDAAMNRIMSRILHELAFDEFGYFFPVPSKVPSTRTVLARMTTAERGILARYEASHSQPRKKPSSKKRT